MEVDLVEMEVIMNTVEESARSTVILLSDGRTRRKLFLEFVENAFLSEDLLLWCGFCLTQERIIVVAISVNIVRI